MFEMWKHVLELILELGIRMCNFWIHIMTMSKCQPKTKLKQHCFQMCEHFNLAQAATVTRDNVSCLFQESHYTSGLSMPFNGNVEANHTQPQKMLLISGQNTLDPLRAFSIH